MEVKSQGVLLHTIPYLGRGRILKVFTPDGLISFFAKHKQFHTLSPFCIAEWVYRKQKSELFSLLECSMENPLLELRESYAKLSAAISIAESLLSSQLPLKPSPLLYLLLCSYLKNLPRFECPEILSASFQMKLLLHEGLIDLRQYCKFCENPGSSLQQGESVCQMHAVQEKIDFSSNEWQALHILTFAKQFSDLLNIQLKSALKNKINALFQKEFDTFS